MVGFSKSKRKKVESVVEESLPVRINSIQAANHNLSLLHGSRTLPSEVESSGFLSILVNLSESGEKIDPEKFNITPSPALNFLVKFFSVEDNFSYSLISTPEEKEEVKQHTRKEEEEFEVQIYD
jgi:hypothetical protein